MIWKAYQFAYQFIFQAFIAYKWKLIRLLIRFAYQFTKSPVKPLPFSRSQSRHLILKNPLNRQLLKKLICKAYQFAYQFKLKTLIGEKQKLIRKLICFAYQFINQISNLTKFCLEIERLICKAYQFAYQFIFPATKAYKWKLIRLLICFAYQFH